MSNKIEIYEEYKITQFRVVVVLHINVIIIICTLKNWLHKKGNVKACNNAQAAQYEKEWHSIISEYFFPFFFLSLSLSLEKYICCWSATRFYLLSRLLS